MNYAEFNQVQIALERSKRASGTRRILLLFWGAIMTKCFAAEWAVQTYVMPFNSLNIWLPTLAFGAVCTLVYGYAQLGALSFKPMSGSYLSAVWFACGVAALLFSLAGLHLHVFDSRLIPGLLAVLMGLGSYVSSTVEGALLNRIVAAGWWSGSLVLLSIDGVDSLLVFAGLIVVLHMLPTAGLMYRSNVKERQAGSADYAI